MGSTENDRTWDWVMSPRAEDQFSKLDSDAQAQIISRLDRVVSSAWREPREFLDPLSGSPFEKLRAGAFRIGCRIVEEDRVLRVESIRKRDGAYSADD